MKLRMRVFRVIILLFVAFLCISIRIPALDAQTTSTGLDILFAVDMSGSMTNSTANNSYDAIDRALNATITSRAATDPDNLTFDSVRFMLDWLADFVDEQAASGTPLDVRARVIGFNQSVIPVLDTWVTVEGRNKATLLFDTPPAPAGVSNSDFFELYRGLDSRFDESGRRRQVLFLVSDSTPCDPFEIRPYRGTSLVITDASCGANTTPSTLLSDHFVNANGLLSEIATQYIYHLSDAAYWARIPNALSNWQDALSRTEDTFAMLDTIDDLPGQLFTDLLNEVAIEVRGGGSANLAEIGIFPAQGSTFEVPPYQTQMDVILFLRGGDESPDFSADSRAVTGMPLYQSESRQLLRLRFPRPGAGQWRVTPSSTLWASYIPAVATARLERVPTTTETNWSPRQYDTVRVVYEIMAGDELLLEPDYLPDFRTVFSAPGSNDVEVAMIPEAESFVSQPFFLLVAGGYSVRIDVQPSWLGTITETPTPEATVSPETRILTDLSDPAAFTFLQPPQISSFRAQPVEFVGIFGSEAAQLALAQTGSIEILRSERVPVFIEARAGGQMIPLPAESEAHLILEGSGCLTNSQPLSRISNRFTISNGLEFETGACAVRGQVDLETDDSIRRVGSDAIPPIAVPLGAVNALTTARLNVALLDPAGEPIPQTSDAAEAAQTFHFTMPDVVTWPPMVSVETRTVRWEPESINLEIVFTDERGQPTNPVFVNAVAPSTDENTDEIDETFPVPFDLRITRIGGEGADESDALDIKPQKSSREGYYVTTISGLEPGEYQLTFTLLRDDPRFTLNELYEYVPELGSNAQVNSPLFIANLRVERNILVVGQQVGFIGLLVLLAVLTVIAIIGWQRRTVAPLRGALAIYYFPPNYKEPEEIWRMKAVPTNRKANTFVYKGSQLRNPRTMDIPLKGLKVTTQRRQDVARRGGASVEITVGGGRVHRYDLRVNEPQPFEENYFIVKFDDTEPSIPPITTFERA